MQSIHVVPKSASDKGTQLTRAERSVLTDIITWYINSESIDAAAQADLEVLRTEINEESAIVKTSGALEHLPDNIISLYADELEDVAWEVDDPDTMFAFYDEVFHGLASKIEKE